MKSLLDRKHLFIIILLQAVFVTFSKASSTSLVSQKNELRGTCKQEESQCMRHLNKFDRLRSRKACQNCYTLCSSELLKDETSCEEAAENCLHKCVDKDCVRGNRGVGLKPLFSCKYTKRHCHQDFFVRKPGFVTSCSKCSEVCETIDEVDSSWCTNRCNERNCSSSPIPSPPTTPTTPPQSNPRSPSVDPVSKNGTNTKPNPSESTVPWKWLVPILIVVLVILFAVIAVVRVRGFRPSPYCCSFGLNRWLGRKNTEADYEENNTARSQDSSDQAEPSSTNLTSFTPESCYFLV